MLAKLFVLRARVIHHKFEVRNYSIWAHITGTQLSWWQLLDMVIVVVSFILDLLRFGFQSSGAILFMFDLITLLLSAVKDSWWRKRAYF